jgi:signal transduction histidine kinase
MTALLSRLSADRMTAEPSFARISPEQVLRRLVSECRSTTPISVTIDAKCVIWADEDHLGEALGHLLSNAIEASPEHAEILVSVSSENGMVVIAIEDHGCGMSPNFIRNELYQPFVSTKPGGFGIGAAEARAMVIAMGGELLVESVEGEGTRFSATFPLHHSLEASEA